jgi:hypothetical protein
MVVKKTVKGGDYARNQVLSLAVYFLQALI